MIILGIEQWSNKKEVWLIVISYVVVYF